MYVRQGLKVLVGTMMASGAGLDLLNIGNNGMQSACPRRLWPHNLRNLELPLRVRGTDNGLEFSSLR